MTLLSEIREALGLLRFLLLDGWDHRGVPQGDRT
jgi:hypothetical protein